MSDKKSDNTPTEETDDTVPTGQELSGDGAPDAEAVADAPGSKFSPSGWGKGKTEALREENAELKDRLLRAAAEMENLRRRTERDKSDTAKFAISSFARDVLTIADNIARAIEHVPEEAAEADEALKSFLDGMQVTERELHNVMERHGITRVNPKGERFDPNLHQAMFEVENTDVAEGTIVEVVQQGYSIADRVLRPALVGIAKGGPKYTKADKTSAPEGAPTAANDDKPASKTDDEGEKASGSSEAKVKSKADVGGNVDKNA